MTSSKTIWTIGHSTHLFDEFLELLRSFEIKMLADIRSFPGSRRYPHFNKEALERTLPEHGIEYIHIPELGGRRKAISESHHPEWKHPAFRSYADYMDTSEFKIGIGHLQELALRSRTAYMCSEALWWRCHRSLVSDYLKSNGWTVLHIMGKGKQAEHPYTTVARAAQEKLF
ncbi:MAG TPA: DUF488 domain-containing protein [Candidatus Kapabacteria bacterium]|nr:DUF488 domain-containing protein [Candidatus Kapabacteria bacterium]